MWLEPYIVDLAKGFLVSGIFLFVISVIFGAMHGISHDHDVGGDHDISPDHDVSFDHDLSADHDFSIDHDMALDHGWDHSGVHGESSETSTPLMLLVSTFMLSFGFFGTTLFEITINPYIRLATILLVPVLVTVVVSNFWRRIAQTELGEIVNKAKIVGKIGIVVHRTSFRGGTIRVEIGPPLGAILLPARTLKPTDEYLHGERVTIVEWDGNICVCDAQPTY